MATIKTLIGNLKSSTYDTYSTNETVVGKWIDGKPIYRKTMEFSNLSAGENIISHGLQNIELLMVNKDWSFLVVTNNNQTEMWQLGNSNQAGNFSQFSCNVVWTTTSTIDVSISSYLTSLSSSVIITFEYTKTTS